MIVRNSPRWLGFVGLVLIGAVGLAACGDDPADPVAVSSEQSQTSADADTAPDPASSASPSLRSPDDPYLTFNQLLVEGFTSEAIDLSSPETLFSFVFAGLPDEVTGYPSENYYYFILYVGGMQVWGNIRLPAGQREDGLLSFGYFEFLEFPVLGERGISGAKLFSEEDGVIVMEQDRFTYSVDFQDKRVLFHFLELDQSQPAALFLAPGERFVERTFDESGYQSYLVFNEIDDYFFWVLNEEEGQPDRFEAPAANLLIGKRSGFAFWVDERGRKILAGIRQLNIRRNDYYDGPFDQLADNYAAEVGISELIQRAFPSLEGQIDTYGYYIDRTPSVRVALSTYRQYVSTSDITQFVAALAAVDDPYAVISRGGRPPATEDGS